MQKANLKKNIHKQWSNIKNVLRPIYFGCYGIKKYILSLNADILLVATPEHGNLGDQAIAIAERQVLRRTLVGARIVEITAPELKAIFSLKRKGFLMRFPFDRRTIVCYHGGGFLGDLWKEEEFLFRETLQRVKNNEIIVLPQTVHFELSRGFSFFFTSKQIYESHPKLIVFLREKISYDFMCKHMSRVKTFCVPDVVANLKFSQNKLKVKRKGILICMRQDLEKKRSDREKEEIESIASEYFSNESFSYTDTVVNHRIRKREREREVKMKLLEFATAKIVITDRLHGMIFAAITGTPCIAMDNISGKVGGVYEWIKENNYVRFMHSVEELPVILKELDVDKEYSFRTRNISNAMVPLQFALKEAFDREWDKDE